MPYAYTAPRFMYGGPPSYGYGAPRSGGYMNGLLSSLGSLTPLLGLGAAALAYKNRGSIGRTIGNLGQSVSNFIQGNGFTPGNMQSGMNYLNANVTSKFPTNDTGNTTSTNTGTTQLPTPVGTNSSGYDPNADFKAKINQSVQNTQNAQDKADKTKQEFIERSKGSNKVTSGYNQNRIMQNTINKGKRAERLDKMKSGIKNAVGKVGNKIAEKNPALANKAKSAMDKVKYSKIGRGITDMTRSAKDAMKDAGKAIKKATGIQKIQNKISDIKTSNDKVNYIAKKDNVSKYTARKILKNEKASRKAAVDAARAAKQNLQTVKNNEAVNIATNQYKIAQNNAMMNAMNPNHNPNK